MSDENIPKAESFGSALNLMAEAVEKASQEFEQIVKDCVREVKDFNDNLEKGLLTRLQKVVEQSTNLVDENIDTMSSRRDELLDKLSDIERQEMAKIVGESREARQQILDRGVQAARSLSKLVEEQLTQLRALVEHPEAHYQDFSTSNRAEIQGLAGEGKAQIESSESDAEQSISTQAREIEQAAQAAVEKQKEGVDSKLEEYSQEFEDKITDVLAELGEVVDEMLSGLMDFSRKGIDRVEQAVEDNKTRIGDQIESFRKDLVGVKENFESGMSEERESAERTHSTLLDRRVTEVKDEINQISLTADAKIASSHKQFYNTLKRLERKYYDRLDRLFNRFETTILEEARLSSAPSARRLQSNHELREKLHLRLQSRGNEIVKTFKRQVEQVEAEFARSTATSHDRIESIRNQAVESMEKQVRVMRTDLDRTHRNFNNELSELALQLPQIEEAGRAAALAVMAYRSAMLSEDNDD